MIGALLIAAASHSSPDSVRVRGVERDTTLAAEATTAGSALRAAVVLPLIGATLRATGPGHWAVSVSGASVELADGIPFGTASGAAFTLAAAPIGRNGELLLPLPVLEGLVAHLGGGLIWDGVHRELRVFRAVVRRAGSPPVREASSAVAASVRVAPSPPPSRPAARRARRRVVVVDAGHGGPDAGMHGSMRGGSVLYEKNVTLAVARRLSAALQDRGLDVVMTRSSDTLIALSDRGRLANRRKGDLFISIHVNAANPNWREPTTARGFETYFLAEAKTEDERRVAQMENDVVRFETSLDAGRDDPLGFVINDMAQNEHLRESSDLALTIQDRLQRVHPGPNRGVRQAGFRVLVTAFMPAVLVEIGFGTNASEAAWISSPDGQREIAAAVADAALEYLGHYERRVSGSGDSAEQRP